MFFSSPPPNWLKYKHKEVISAGTLPCRHMVGCKQAVPKAGQPLNADSTTHHTSANPGEQTWHQGVASSPALCSAGCDGRPVPPSALTGHTGSWSWWCSWRADCREFSGLFILLGFSFFHSFLKVAGAVCRAGLGFFRFRQHVGTFKIDSINQHRALGCVRCVPSSPNSCLSPETSNAPALVAPKG